VVKGVTEKASGPAARPVPLTPRFLPLPSTIILLSMAMVVTNITQAAEAGHTIRDDPGLWPILWR